MRFSSFVFFFAFGATLVVLGFVYDLSYAGIPYPDPTAEMQQRWLFHKGVSDRIIFAGMTVFGVGSVWKAAQLIVRLTKRQHSD